MATHSLSPETPDITHDAYPFTYQNNIDYTTSKKQIACYVLKKNKVLLLPRIVRESSRHNSNAEENNHDFRN